MTITRRPWFWPVAAILIFAVVGSVRAWPAGSVVPGGVPNGAYPLWSFWHFAYSDIVALYSTRGIYLHLWPYIQVPLEYPPVLGTFLWLASWAPHVWGYLVVNILVLTGCAIGAAFIAARLVGWKVARLWAFSPLLAIYMIYNWDALGILTYALAALQYKRGRYLWTGVWLGLGISTKLFPIVMLPFFLAERWQQGDRAGARQIAGWTGLSFLVVNLPFAALNFSGWSTFWTFNTVRNASPGFWQWLVGRHVIGVAAVDGLSLLLVAVAALVLLAAVWRGQMTPLLAGALLLTWWLFMNKVYSPQYVLWVLFALVIADGIQGSAWMLNVAGYLDFALAMLWLATGYGHSPEVSLVGHYMAPAVILFRYATFINVLVRQRLGARFRGTVTA
jgi:hypothetical protein